MAASVVKQVQFQQYLHSLNASSERDAFDQMDKTAKIRPAMVESLKEKFGDQLTFSIGGQISFDVFPTGWDKTYCLQFLEEYDEGKNQLVF